MRGKLFNVQERRAAENIHCFDSRFDHEEVPCVIGF